MTSMTNAQAATLLVLLILAVWKLLDLGVAVARCMTPRRPLFPSEDEPAIQARLSRLRRAGICDACYGRGYYDNPPWGITPCDDWKVMGQLK